MGTPTTRKNLLLSSTSSTSHFIAVAFVCLVASFTVLVPTPVAAEGTKPAFQVVHIGDSYSSGNGARNANGDADYTGPAGCNRSPSSWGNQYANWLSQTQGVTVDYRNHACDGATLGHMNRWRYMNHFRVAKHRSCPLAEHPQDEHLHLQEKQFSNSCQRWLRPQLDAITADTDLVLLTLGGNNLGFRSIVTNCMAPVLRDPATCENLILDAENELAGIQQQLVDLLAEMRRRLHPNAKVVIVEYPHLIEDTNYTVRQTFGRESFAAGPRIRNISTALSGHQRAATDQANAAAGQPFVEFVDSVKPHFVGRAPNPGTFRQNPSGWFNEFTNSRSHETYHLNSNGHRELARLVAQHRTFGATNN